MTTVPGHGTSAIPPPPPPPAPFDQILQPPDSARYRSNPQDVRVSSIAATRVFDQDHPSVAVLNRRLADLRHQKERIDIAIAVLEEVRAELLNGTTR